MGGGMEEPELTWKDTASKPFPPQLAFGDGVSS